MFCPKCGKKIKGRERFCTNCGENVGEEAHIIFVKRSCTVGFTVATSILAVFIVISIVQAKQRGVFYHSGDTLPIGFDEHILGMTSEELEKYTDWEKYSVQDGFLEFQFGLVCAEAPLFANRANSLEDLNLFLGYTEEGMQLFYISEEDVSILKEEIEWLDKNAKYLGCLINESGEYISCIWEYKDSYILFYFGWSHLEWKRGDLIFGSKKIMDSMCATLVLDWYNQDIYKDWDGNWKEELIPPNELSEYDVLYKYL